MKAKRAMGGIDFLNALLASMSWGGSLRKLTPEYAGLGCILGSVSKDLYLDPLSRYFLVSQSNLDTVQRLAKDAAPGCVNAASKLGQK